MHLRRIALGLVWTSFYEQLAWTSILIVLAIQVGDPEVIALAASAYSLANLFGNLAFGALSDRWGRLHLAAGGLCAMAATAAAHLAAQTPAALVWARFAHGLAAGAVAPAALATLSETVPTARRGEAMARAGLIIALAGMISPPLSGRLVDGIGVAATVGVLAAVLAGAGLLTFRWASAAPPAERPTRRHDAAPPEQRAPTGPVAVFAATFSAFSLMFAQNTLFYAVPLRAAELGMRPAIIGILFSAFAVGALAAFVPPLSRAADRWGRWAPLRWGLGLGGVAMAALTWATTPARFVVPLAVYGLGFGLVFPAVAALIADAMGSERRGLSYGLLTAAFSAGSIVGPVTTKALSGWIAPFTSAGALLAAAALAATAAPAWRRKILKLSRSRAGM